jgi:type I restriction enzyme S subunit
MSLPFIVPAHWQVVPFGELVHDSAFGPRFGAEHYSNDGNIATLRIMDIGDDGVVSYSAMPLARLPEQKFSNHFLETNDLVIARTGVTCGTAAVFSHWHLPVVPGAFLIRFRLTANAVPKYYCYFFNLSIGRKHLLSVSSGACQTNLNITNVKRLAVPLPTLEEQNAIVDVLSSYDGLIENNTRRIRILEETAEMIYREWFVNFRFPGHEKVGMIESSEMGLIPEKWKTASFAEIASFVNGYAFGPEHWGTTGKPIIKIKELKSGVRRDTPRYDGPDLASKYNVRSGDVLFSWSADLDVYIWAGEDGLLNQHLFRVTSENSLGRILLFHSLKHRIGDFRSRSMGNTMKHIKRGALNEVRTVIPESSVRAQFEALVEPMADLATNLRVKNIILRRTRDLLLPRLLSGEISVERAETEAVAQGV